MSSLWQFIRQLAGIAPEVPSPVGEIPFANITTGKNEKGGWVKIEGLPLPLWIVQNPHDTNSMDAGFDVGDTSVMTANPDFIKNHTEVGDWIAWIKNLSFGRFHQVIRKGDDGRPYFETKGVNLMYSDYTRVRLEDIRGNVLMIIHTEPKGPDGKPVAVNNYHSLYEN